MTTNDESFLALRLRLDGTCILANSKTHKLGQASLWQAWFVYKSEIDHVNHSTDSDVGVGVLVNLRAYSCSNSETCVLPPAAVDTENEVCAIEIPPVTWPFNGTLRQCLRDT